MFVWRSDWEELKERVRRLELQQNDWERDGHRISFTDGKVCMWHLGQFRLHHAVNAIAKHVGLRFESFPATSARFEAQPLGKSEKP